MGHNLRGLAEEFCRLTGLTDAAAIAEGAPVEVDGVDCAIVPSEGPVPGSFVLYADFGPLPGTRYPAILEALLARNFDVALRGGASLGYSTLSGRILSMQQLDARDVSADRLLRMMRELSFDAREWRQTYFISRSDEAPPPALPTGTLASRRLRR